MKYTLHLILGISYSLVLRYPILTVNLLSIRLPASMG